MKLRLLLALLLYSYALSAQLIQMNQTPLEYHPSFAGNTGGGRLAYASSASYYKLEPNKVGSEYANYYSSLPTISYTSLTNHLSYDDVWRKKGIGWGLSLSSASSFWGEEYKRYINNPSYFAKPRQMRNPHQISAQAMIAPKYTLKDIDGNNKYTFSPSLKFGYHYYNQSFPSKTYFYSSPGQESPPRSYSYLEIGGFGDYDTYYRPKHEYNVTLGMLLNSKKGFVGLAFKHTTMTFSIFEHHIRYGLPVDTLTYSYPITDSTSYTYTNISYTPYETVTNKTPSFSFPSFSLTAGRTFQFREGSKFSFTPQLYVSLATFYKRPEKLAGHYSSNFDEKRHYNPSSRRFELAEWFQRNSHSFYLERVAFNLHVTWDKWFLGYGTSSTTGTNVNVFGGYQNQKCRMGLTYSWNEPYNFIKSAGAISFSYFFKKEQE